MHAVTNNLTYYAYQCLWSSRGKSLDTWFVLWYRDHASHLHQILYSFYNHLNHLSTSCDKHLTLICLIGYITYAFFYYKLITLHHMIYMMCNTLLQYEQRCYNIHGRAWGGGQGVLTPPKFWKAPFDPPKFREKKKIIHICIW